MRGPVFGRGLSFLEPSKCHMTDGGIASSLPIVLPFLYGGRIAFLDRTLLPSTESATMPEQNLPVADLRALTRTYVQEWVERGYPTFQAFCNWSLEHVLWDHNPGVGQIEAATRLGSAGDRGIDAFFIGQLEDGSYELHIVQSKDTAVNEEVVTKLVDNFVNLFPATSSNSAFVRANDELAQEARQFQTDYLENANIRTAIKFTVVTSVVAQQSVRQRAEEFGTEVHLLLDSGATRTLPSTVEIVDIKDLVEGLGEIRTDITFETDVTERHFLENRDSQSSSLGSATLVVPAQEIADLYNREGIELFRHNPRYFQSKRTTVNKEMLRTLESDYEKHNFYIYNNGLTAICDSYVIEEQAADTMSFDSDKQYRVRCQNFQIVNGCQTTVTLWNAHRSASGLAGVNVQLKIIESTGPIAPSIARYTNSQNRMKAEDYRTNEPIHHQLQNELKRLTSVHPWFYEYKRGEWNTDYSTVAKKRPFVEGTDRYGTRKFGVKDLAQACLSFLGDPRTASDAVATIFNDDSNYQKVFPDGVSALQLLFPRIIFLEIEKFMNEHSEDYDSSWALYLKHRETFIVGRLLNDIVRPSQQSGSGIPYFDRQTSELLLNSVATWVGDIVEATLPDLRQFIADRADSNEISHRQQVRRNDYLQSAFNTVERNFNRSVLGAIQLSDQAGADRHSIGPLQHFPSELIQKTF